jgi:hypothetical protein
VAAPVVLSKVEHQVLDVECSSSHMAMVVLS